LLDFWFWQCDTLAIASRKRLDEIAPGVNPREYAGSGEWSLKTIKVKGLRDMGEQETLETAPVELQPRRSPLQERAKQTVRKILDTTAELLDEEGHENLTTERVAERSGVNIATLYHYFPNKLALLHALALQFAEQQQEEIDAIYADRAETDWRDTQLYIERHIEQSVGEAAGG